jgi:hypothetical protein
VIILALDLSSKTGWAVGAHTDARPSLGLWHLPSEDGFGRQGARLGDALGDAIAVHAPDVVLAEVDVLLHRQNPDRTAYQQIGMSYFCEVVCFRRGVRFERRTARQARQAIIGRSHWGEGETKPAIIKWCNTIDRNLKITDHNVADSYVLWRYGVHLFGRKAA